jgi:hypothetical protein
VAFEISGAAVHIIYTVRTATDQGTGTGTVERLLRARGDDTMAGTATPIRLLTLLILIGAAFGQTADAGYDTTEGTATPTSTAR